MIEYHNFLKTILNNGTVKSDRTGTGTISLFGPQMEFDLSKGFPLVTTKKMFTKGIIAELLWFLEGSTDERRLAEIQYGLPRQRLLNKQTIWTANADKQGRDLGYVNDALTKELGPIYGHQWRSTPTYQHQKYPDRFTSGPTIDQIEQIIRSIKTNPDSRRHIVSAWNVSQISDMALPPCHTMFQFNVSDGKLDCKLYQRSADAFLGVPYNIASYALLTLMVAQVCNLRPGRFIHTFGDAHIYLNHIDQVKLQLTREPMPLPVIDLDLSVTDIDDFAMDSFTLSNYTHHDTIKGDMAV